MSSVSCCGLFYKEKPAGIHRDRKQNGGVPGAGEGGNGEDRVSAWQEEKVREVDGADGPTLV